MAESGSGPQAVRVLFIGTGPVGEVTRELEAGRYAPVSHSTTSSAGLREALRGEWDIAISDFVVSREFTVLDALRVIQEHNLDLPLIVISGRIRSASVVAALKAGAADHMTRGNLMRLNAAVEREIRAARLRRERVRLEEQFRQAQKMEAVGRLASGVAHDFNNLLTVITGYGDLLATSSLDQGQRAAVEEIRRSAERGGALTHQLLAFSRRQPLETTALELNRLLMQVEKMLRRLIGEDIELVTIPAASRDLVEADRGRLEQVIMNLVVNARDAMPLGGKLTIETGTIHLDESFTAKRLGVEAGSYVTISVTDTGFGMDEETQTRLFEPFFTTKGPGRGTGLGLATAYGIIRQMGGAISITSELGKGTVARIFLPAAGKKLGGEAVMAATGPPATGAETILLVEDEARVRKLVRDVLAGRGYRVLEATRGSEALHIVKEYRGPIDLAVVDVVMPEMSGPEVVKRISRHLPGMKVLYVSGYTDEAIVHHHIPESGRELLQKPFLPEVLARKVREVLDAGSPAGKHA